MARRPLRYWLRRVAVNVVHPTRLADCALRSCPEPAVGITVWCTEHVAQIRENRKCPELAAHLARRRAEGVS